MLLPGPSTLPCQVEVHLHEAGRVKAKLAADATRAESTLTALALETETVGRALKAAAGDKERALVEHDVLALQVRAVCVEGEGGGAAGVGQAAV
jgi:hypothetical protein